MDIIEILKVLVFWYCGGVYGMALHQQYGAYDLAGRDHSTDRFIGI